MIKLIASDLDGTLLQNGAQSLQGDIFDMICGLTKQGILFVAASGRQYTNVKRLFLPVWEQIAFICENGSLTMQGDKTVRCQPVPWAMGQKIMADIQAAGLEVLLCCREASYVTGKNRPFADHMVYEMRNNVAIVEDLFSLPDEYLKISAYVPEKCAAKEAVAFQEKWGNYLNVAVAGDAWVDFTVADKGTALKDLQVKLGLQKEEMIAFGDNFNDESMLQAVGKGYIMAGADPRLHKPGMQICHRVEDELMLLLAQKG